nr:GGDEF domain-containing protein [uncultured Cohaesibacter sp.]
MSTHRETTLESIYRQLGKVKTSGQALLISGIIATISSLLSSAGALLAFRAAETPLLPLVIIWTSLLPFAFILASSFLLLRGFQILDRRNKILSEEVARDNLTRLANRYAFVRRGRNMLQQAHLQQTPLSLILLDADHFKSINDNHGHLAGDLALQHLAKILSQTSRESDVVARWGGEEFAILLRGADLQGAFGFADRLRERISSTPFYWNGKQVQITMSAGVTEWQQDDDDLHHMIIRADEALYKAKSKGRNQVQLSHEQTEPVDGFELDVALCDAAA